MKVTANKYLSGNKKLVVRVNKRQLVEEMTESKNKI
jgi:hypothetical protein